MYSHRQAQSEINAFKINIEKSLHKEWHAHVLLEANELRSKRVSNLRERRNIFFNGILCYLKLLLARLCSFRV